MKRGILLPEAYRDLFRPARYKVYYGGRGAGKSWAMARALVLLAASSSKRILCAREFQTSMADSVYRLLADQIRELGVGHRFQLRRNGISAVTGSHFLFKGLRHHIQEIKSTEGIDICWVEEAQAVRDESWEILLPTIRAPHSEIWVSFNPGTAEDATYRRFVTSPPPEAVVRHVGWQDNPWLPAALDAERKHLQSKDPLAYQHIWEGEPRAYADAVVFNDRISVRAFPTPDTIERFYFGADWGFAKDPTVLVRCFIADHTLYVDYEAYGVGTELDRLPALFEQVPGARDWPIRADGSRPETISFMRRLGFSITKAAKWSGSVEDGIAHLKSYREIVVHERCPHLAREFAHYAYKVDRVANAILPVLVDADNHAIDALRYSLDGVIRQNNAAIWERLCD